ncbi:hypothetical protein INQ45_11270 [Flavobacterium columnare]|uniref:hypothetical protein n=1 Tax=Flavobacterium columnare TaxID=996 RepID=UPI002D213600|nr:hypothetical protein [Flavobacterium columnare]MEB3801609.1 hypothetical protein [Flavobacterium columnare]
MITQNPNINDNNLVEEIIKSVKHYPSDKINILSYDKHFCDFEVFVNGLSVYKKFDNESGSSAFDINPYVFKTGEYNVKYKLYSVNKEDESNFKENTIFNLNLESYSLNSAENEKTHYKYSVPYLKNEFIGTNRNIFEDTFKVKIEVPYNITPDFENAQNLTKLDKKQLEQKVLEKYNQIREIYVKKNADDIAKLIYAKTILEFQTTYADKEKVAGYWKLYKNI